MKLATSMIRQIAIDSLSFMLVTTIALGGLWGLAMIEAPLFTMTIYSALMVPALLSTSYYLGKDINKATHILVA